MSFQEHWRLWRAIGKQIRGDVLYAFKPILTSYGAALAVKVSSGLPVILDIEDWDAYPFHTIPLRSRIRLLMSREVFRNPFSPNSLGFMELLIPLADRIIVSSKFLQRRYGGQIVVQGVDCGYFDPKHYDRQSARARIGISDSAFVILFAGTVHLHKGVDILLDAVSGLSMKSVKVMILVVGSYTPEAMRLVDVAKGMIVHMGPKPHSEMPLYLAASDLVCLPQRNTPYAQAQIPAKLFEAMAMAKPIIATRVSDLPMILKDCGIIVPPADVDALREAIAGLIESPQVAYELGQAARKRCVTHYSWDAMEMKLCQIIESV